MSVTPSNNFKIGLFVILAIAAAVTIGLVVGGRELNRDTVTYHTYFNESVAGLDQGAPVKFRGVKIGSVAGIQIAPDHRHVDVVSELDVERSAQLGLGGAHATNVPPDLRAQIGTQGITGVKYVSIDFVDVEANPPPLLPFKVADAYIPAAKSTLKNLEDSLAKALDRVPDLVDTVQAVSSRVDRLIEQLEKEDAGGRIAAILKHADGALASLASTVKELERSGLPSQTAKMVDEVRGAVSKLNAVLDQVSSETGLLASVQRASDALGGFGRGAGASTRELDQTLREVREAAEGIRNLTDELERDPDMLIKGRGKAKGAR